MQAELLIPFSEGGLAAGCLGNEMLLTDLTELLLNRVYLLTVVEERALALHLERDERIGGNKLSLEIWERWNSEIGF